MAARELESLASRWRDFQQVQTLREHWYWRPGWGPGRSFYTWHLTFAGQQALHDLVGRIQAALDVPGMDPVPPDGLHLTMQGLGFTDEVPTRDAELIVAAARARLASLPPVEIALGPVDPDAEGVGLLVSPWEPVERVRLAIRDAIRAVWPEVPEPEGGFRPHVTVAYSGVAVPAGPVRSALAALRALPPAQVRVGEAQLIALRRDDRVYRWDAVASARLAG